MNLSTVLFGVNLPGQTISRSVRTQKSCNLVTRFPTLCLSSLALYNFSLSLFPSFSLSYPSCTLSFHLSVILPSYLYPLSLYCSPFLYLICLARSPSLYLSLSLALYNFLCLSVSLSLLFFMLSVLHALLLSVSLSLFSLILLS